MNHHCVLDFDIHMDDEDYSFPIPSANKKPIPSMGDEEIMELLWQNGQVVMQTQNHRPVKKPPPPARISGDGPSTARDEVNNYNQHLFMQEDEMTSWLHYPIHNDDDPPILDQNFCADLLYAPPTVNNANNNNNNSNNHNSAMQTLPRTSQLTELRHPPRMAPPRPPIPPYFACFSKHNARAEPGPSSSSKNVVAKENTVVDSCETPVPTAVTAAVSRFSETVRSSADRTEGDGGLGSMSISSAGAAAPSTTSAGGGRGTMTCGMTMTSSPGGSSSSGELGRRVTAEDRKRKGREEEEWEFQSEDVDFESAEAKKQVRGSTSTKRSRAAEVHNLSERRRRDRINEKMKALQELIPRCNKSDKASMLDEAIEYLKSLQSKVQMMSMGCSMVPMMFAGFQQYMPAMGMGIGMGMGMDMGMNRPVMPFPNMLAGSALPAATAAAHLGPRFPMPPFHMPHVHAGPDSSRMQAANPSDNNMLTSVGTPDPSQSRIPNFTDPYQQYLSPQMQFQLMQNKAMNQLNVSKPSSSSRGPENPENHQSGELL